MTEDYQAWIGRQEEKQERILASSVEAMAATLDLERPPRAGEGLPPGWQWMFFNPVARLSALGPDGSLALWARGPDGELSMSATATFR